MHSTDRVTFPFDHMNLLDPISSGDAIDVERSLVEARTVRWRWHPNPPEQPAQARVRHNFRDRIPEYSGFPVDHTDEEALETILQARITHALEGGSVGTSDSVANFAQADSVNCDLSASTSAPESQADRPDGFHVQTCGSHDIQTS